MHENFPDHATYQLWHTYEIDGDPDYVRTVVSRCVDFTRDGANYVMLADPNDGAKVAIYPVEPDGDCEALLFPNADPDDVDRDGGLLPYWVSIRESEDVSGGFPEQFPPNRA